MVMNKHLQLLGLLLLGANVWCVDTDAEDTLGNMVTLDFKNSSQDYACQKAYRIFFEGCNLTSATAPDCNVRIEDYWEGQQNSDYYRVASIHKIQNNCHEVLTPNYHFRFSPFVPTASYKGELRLELRDKTATTTWGWFIIPLSGGATTVPGFTPAPTPTVGSNNGLSANNFLQTDSPLATFRFDYDVPMAHYIDSAGVKYFYFMGWMNSATIFTATEAKKCPAVTVTDMSLRNCWDTGIVTGYGEFVGTGLRTNFALWTAVSWMLIFFVWSNGAENDSKLSDRFNHNLWTLHPLYSIWQYGSDQFNKTSRLCVMLGTISIQQLIVSIFYYNSVNKSDISMYTYIIGWAAISYVISIPQTYLLALPLMQIYDTHAKYARDFRNNKDVKHRDFITDQYELSKIRLYFKFYFILLCCTVICFSASVFLIQHLEPNDHWNWFASVGGCWLLDMLIMDLLIVGLGKVPVFFRVLRQRGYYIDYDLDQKMRSLEMEQLQGTMD